ncbi:flagellar biosynthesis anti-sigma factor FlgM [Castellaniella sp.]|uniref:flagellar biosynthesis anti-sigma factor FlgM n=1 Tax=Castellaniella sp. TaxID=1955812 RepID=UPI003565A99E
MKIPALPNNQVSSRNAPAPADGPLGSTAGSTAPRRSTDPAVALSPASRQLTALHDPTQDVDMARVQQIRQALDEGTLVIRPERIAQGLIQSALELLHP